MKAGDFSQLAKDYSQNRPDYSVRVRDQLIERVGSDAELPISVVDVGAGTGIWTRMLAEKGLTVKAVEPNDAMRAEGKSHPQNGSIEWFKGSGEETGLEDGCANWVTMASSFHWTDPKKSLPEFSRLLKKSGYVTVLWNPRNISGHPLHEEIEAIVNDNIPNLKRVSSGASKHTADWDSVLTESGLFKDVLFVEDEHQITMSKERYMGAWRSVNDIQRQAGPENWQKILTAIEKRIESLPDVTVPYKTRSWTAKKVI